MEQIAFLRGINVVGRNIVPMAALRKTFEKLGCENVRTLLNSGNVIYEPPARFSAKRVIAGLEDAFGFPIHVILRSRGQLDKLAKADPFERVRMTPKTMRYITFLTAKPKSPPKTPYRAEHFDFRILKVTEGEVLSVVEITPRGHTPEAMVVLEKFFGKDITTRNWNTVMKLLALKGAP